VGVLDWIAVVLIAAAMFFFLGGTLGLLRFPDVYNRLHAMTKADNVGLGLVTLALALRAGSLLAAAKLVLVWMLVLVAGTTACHLIARKALPEGITPWKKPPSR
jgi:multicomponent Na+:H+ antiporter subunit G